ncbi:MAG: adenylate/guanylate cyclase domain-containing protein [Geminicoccaceae bacterium]
MARSSSALPDLSARALLMRAEAEADLLYAGVRTLILAVFWLLFLAASDGHHHDSLTAGALVGYSVLATLSWFAVCYRWNSRAFVLTCVTADALLAATLLAGLAVAADMPTSRLFALPASGLAFLLVAHAALRFNASTVLYAGVTVVGVLALVMAAPHWRPFEPLHGYHVPMADYWPVLPLATLALTTIVLWFVARRTHGLLEKALTATQRAARLERFFSPAVAQRLGGAESVRELAGDRREVAILFVDIRGFTALAERMQPEELGPFLAEFRRLVTRAVFACKGSIDKFIGDGALAVFGAPEQHANPAACALRCIGIMQAGIAGWSRRRLAMGQQPVRIAAGGHFGEVFAGVVGQDGMLEFTVLGDTVNVAERLHRIAADRDLALVVSDALRRTYGPGFPDDTFINLGELRLPGRKDVVACWGRTAGGEADNSAQPASPTGPLLLAVPN